jgi:hypothetical protein
VDENHQLRQGRLLIRPTPKQTVMGQVEWDQAVRTGKHRSRSGAKLCQLD